MSVSMSMRMRVSIGMNMSMRMSVSMRMNVSMGKGPYQLQGTQQLHTSFAVLANGDRKRHSRVGLTSEMGDAGT